MELRVKFGHALKVANGLSNIQMLVLALTSELTKNAIFNWLMMNVRLKSACLQERGVWL